MSHELDVPQQRLTERVKSVGKTEGERDVCGGEFGKCE